MSTIDEELTYWYECLYTTAIRMLIWVPITTVTSIYACYHPTAIIGVMIAGAGLTACVSNMSFVCLMIFKTRQIVKGGSDE